MRLRRDAKIELVSRVPLFAGCSKRELGRIAAIADELHLAPGAELMREGARGGEFCVLVEGSVDVRRRGRKLRTLSSGDFFGEIALLTDAPRTASVTAAQPVRLLVVERDAFRRLLEDVPAIRDKVLRALVARTAPGVA
ncbi:MAG TPA: cyclic nucleotide-binding domain-containing protein [Gaiellaceae bacterium]|nr:cyclic nucleotide-binding domain-containing protein [Gaiellaceae bacterium]